MKLSDRRVKIVATVGPSIASKDGLRNAIRAGMNVARLNFSTLISSVKQWFSIFCRTNNEQ